MQRGRQNDRPHVNRQAGFIASVTLLNLAVALVAFLKEAVLAAYLGTGPLADALTIAFFLPDAIGNNLLPTILVSAGLPILARLHQREAGGYEAGVRWTSVVAAASGLAAAMAILMLHSPLLRELAGGDASGIYPLLVILLPILVLAPLGAVFGAILQIQDKFNWVAAGPLILNGGLTCGILIVARLHPKSESGIALIAWAITLSTAATTGWLLVRMRAGGLSPARRHPVRTKQLRQWAGEFWALSWPLLFILLFPQIQFGVERALAARQAPGSAAALYYAYRLAQFPVWSLVAAVTAVLFPSLSRLAHSGAGEALGELLHKALWSTVCLVLPVAILLSIFSAPLVSILFQHGAFNGHSLQMTSGILSGYALSAVGQSVSLIGLRYYLAVGRPKRLLFICAGSAAAAIGLDLLLVPRYGVQGIGYGALAGACINGLGLFLAIIAEIKSIFRTNFDIYVKMGLAAGAMAMVLSYLNAHWMESVAGEAWPLLLRTGISGVLGFLVYGLILILTKAHREWLAAGAGASGGGKQDE